MRKFDNRARKLDNITSSAKKEQADSVQDGQNHISVKNEAEAAINKMKTIDQSELKSSKS